MHDQIASFTLTLPVLPPIISNVGRTSLKPQNFMAFAEFPSNSSFLIGVPVTTALPAGSFSRVSGKLQQTFDAFGMAILFANPGVISDS